MVDSETEPPPSSLRGMAPESKATTALAAGASKKAAGQKNPTASGGAAAEPGQPPLVPDPAGARTQYPWLLSQDGSLSLAPSGGPFSETGDGGDDVAGSSKANPVGADGEAAAGRIQPGQPAGTSRVAGELKRELAGIEAPAGGEQPSNSSGDAAVESAVQAADMALGTGESGTASLVPLTPGPQAGGDGVRGATQGAGGARTARREPLAAVSGSQITASSPATTAAASPDRQMSGAARERVEPNQSTSETPPLLARAADPAMEAQAASTAAAEAAGAAASPFAPLVARGGGRTLDPDREEGDSSGATAVAGAGSSDDDGLATQGTLAFQAWLVPAPAPVTQPGQGLREAGDRQPALEAGGTSGGRSGFRSTRDADPGLAGTARSGPAGGAPEAEPAVHGLSLAATVSSNVGTGLASAPQGASAHRAASPASADLSAWEAGQPPSKPAAGGAAREIQLELRDADVRVNVRLVERAGSVQVDVRTPDSHLAGSLRDDLPSLTARLEQTGLRAETWHDAPAAAAARIKMTEPIASAGFQSSQNQSRREGGGRERRDGQPQEKRQNQNQPESKEFSWHYTSLQ